MSHFKRYAAILTLTLILSNLYASPIIGLGLGYRNSSYFADSGEVEVHVRDNSYKVGILSGFAEYIRLSGEYTFTPVNTLKIDLFSSYYHAYEVGGGMAHIAFKIGQDLRFSSLLLNYRIGLIGGLSYSEYSSDIQYSLSPDVVIEMGLDLNNRAELLLYLRSECFYETAFQSIPNVGFKGLFNLNDRNIIFLDTYLVLGDYMEGPSIVIKDYVIRIAYEVVL